MELSVAEKQMSLRKEVERMIMKELYMKKICADNTYYISLASKRSGAEYRNFGSFLLPNHRKQHIKQCLLSVVEFSIKTTSDNFDTNAASTKLRCRLELSGLRNQVYSSNTADGQAVAGTDEIISRPGQYPLLHLNSNIATEQEPTHLFLDYKGPEVLADNPFGKNFNVKVRDVDNLLFDEGETLTSDTITIITVKIELLPDFNENDRLNY